MNPYFLRVVYFSILCVTTFGGPPTFADSDSSTTPVIHGTGHGHHAGIRISAKNAKGNAKTIQGNCETVSSPSNPIAGPCVNLVLILKDSAGNEVVKNRTSPQGRFEFPTEPGKDYTIASGSRYFDVVEGKSTVHSGSKILVHLKQK